MESQDNAIFDILNIREPRISEIKHGLYLGDEKASSDLNLLKDLKIKRIIRVGSELKICFPDELLFN